MSRREQPSDRPRDGQGSDAASAHPGPYEDRSGDTDWDESSPPGRMAAQPAALPLGEGRVSRPVPRLRRRLMLAFGGAIVLTTVALSLAAYFLVAAALSREARDAALGQSRFNLLLAQTLLPEQPAGSDYDRLLAALAIRGGFQTLVTDKEADYRSGPQITRELVSPELTAAVTPDRLTYQETTVGNDRAIAVGARVRVGGPALYFFFSQAGQQTTLHQLRNVLAGAGLVLAVLGLVTGWILSRRLAGPVGAAAGAASRVASGGLSVRLREGDDEFGTLGTSFNTMARTLRVKLDDLQAAEARERRFTADVAHELRTPVAALVGEASLLERALSSTAGESLPPETRRALALLAKDVARLRRLIDDLLEISRIDAHSADVQWETFAVMDFLARMAAARHWPAEVRVAAPASLAADDPGPASPDIRVTSDRRRFERIVGNLVDNALAHGRPPVMLEARLVAPGDRAPQLVLSVTDHGPGIPPEHLSHLFERFYKADPSRLPARAASSGTGLGLSIAWENARLLGGTLRVRSNPGEGTRFTLRLPLSPPEALEGWPVAPERAS